MGRESPPEHRTTIAFRLREAAGMTQEEAADTVQINVRSWQRFESRAKPIPEAIVRLFCAKTQLDEGAFLPGREGDRI